MLARQSRSDRKAGGDAAMATRVNALNTSEMGSSLDIYNEHFGLRERPFSLQPDPDFMFWSPMHRWTYTMLEYGLLTKAPITLITGEVGAGKTTLLQYLLRTLGDDMKVGLVSNAQGDAGRAFALGADGARLAGRSGRRLTSISSRSSRRA